LKGFDTAFASGEAIRLLKRDITDVEEME